MLRIAITDDHAMFRDGLELLINTFPGMEVVINTPNNTTLLEKLQDAKADIVLLNIPLPVTDDFRIAGILKAQYPEIRILAITGSPCKAGVIIKAAEAGIHGLFTKNVSPEELETALRKLKQGRFYFEEYYRATLNTLLNNIKLMLKQGKYI